MPHFKFYNLTEQEVQGFVDDQLNQFIQIANCPANKVTIRLINAKSFNTKHNKLEEPIFVHIDWMPRSYQQKEQVQKLLTNYLKHLGKTSIVVTINDIDINSYFKS
ncbi:DUF1904 family protein [Spiroplasma endosymbiont of Amphibalanus improvisus]|uniref:DUF1904 family protein n=1 Tax=Spiroplasma endosymbiont of Amphibalanus improvisus TaxID=3066327 RepID=UPI00313B8B85